VQQEVERTLRASTSTANQSSTYVAQQEEHSREGAVHQQPSLTEMPSFVAPENLSGPTQTVTDRAYPQSAPDTLLRM
jgi:hypothetical protein